MKYKKKSVEIKKIAREYAENVKSEYVSAKLIETLVMGFYHSRLKTDYCIVSKEEIKDDYNSNAWAAGQLAKGAGARCAQMREWHQGKCDELISLFGKELFEEGKE